MAKNRLTNRLIVILLLLVLLLGMVLMLFRRCGAQDQVFDTYSDLPARVEQVREMVRLSSMEIDKEMVVVDTINRKVLCAVVGLHGEITFDLERMPIAVRGDTLYVQLPPEKIVCYERSYRVVDSYSLDQPLGFNLEMLATEENLLKRRIPARFEDEMYRRGKVEEARATARESISRLLSHVSEKVVVVDLYPMGSRGVEFPDSIDLQRINPELDTKLKVTPAANDR